MIVGRVGKRTRTQLQRGLAYVEGQLPVPAEQLPTGTILIKEVKAGWDAVGLYARVSSLDQKRDVEAQLGRLVVYAHKHGWQVSVSRIRDWFRSEWAAS